MESIVFDGSSREVPILPLSRPRRKASFFSSATIALEVFAAARWNTLNVGHVQLRFSTFEVAGR
jgi:hypothetical protein